MHRKIKRIKKLKTIVIVLILSTILICGIQIVKKNQKNSNKIINTTPTPTVASIPTPTTQPGCSLYWWFDSDHKTCQQENFCGNHMYHNLRTFNTQDECLKALQISN